ncbi:hypothetical protein MBLNU457_3872t1 [Dothideomycetes sp. NU457]
MPSALSTAITHGFLAANSAAASSSRIPQPNTAAQSTTFAAPASMYNTARTRGSTTTSSTSREREQRSGMEGPSAFEPRGGGLTTGASGNAVTATTSSLLGGRNEQGDEVSIAWKSFALACEPIIHELLDVYMRIVYPLYPLFHEADFRARVRDREHLSDRGLFASVMGACALASARLRDGALPKYPSEHLSHPQVSSEVFFTAARDAFQKDLADNVGFEYLRACVLLALTSIQWGHIGSMQQYMGMFFTMATMQRLYDERFWENGLSPGDLEIRRRIYWCAYSLDVYSTTIWNCFFRSQEEHTNVLYPGEEGHEELPESHSDNPSWLIGWNFTTDLYRVLEHALSKVRARKFFGNGRRQVDGLAFQDQFDDQKVMRTILGMYYELPAKFKETPPMTGDMRRDIFAYQAANIQATLQLVRMIMFSMDDGAGVDRKCDVVTEVLSVFHTIPREYLRGISMPLIYHLGHIGQVLASVIDEHLTEARYQRVRTCVLSLADLVETLEQGLSRAAGATVRLRESVDKLDTYMQQIARATQQGYLQQPAQVRFTSQTGIIGQQEPTGALINNDFQLPPELFGDWSWPPEFVIPNGPPYYIGNSQP